VAGPGACAVVDVVSGQLKVVGVDPRDVDADVAAVVVLSPVVDVSAGSRIPTRKAHVHRIQP
jgi:hypothetical protein